MTGDELLAAIWAAPHDDEVRLVYADHCERTGDHARAEIIQLQIALARMPEDDPRRAAIVKRERHLWQSERKHLRRGLPDPLRGAEFRRGFVHPVVENMATHKFFARLYPLLPLAPGWDVWLAGGTEPQLATLFASERLARICGLQLNSPGKLATLARAPHAVNLAYLDWSYTREPGSTIALLAALPHLRELHLQNCWIDHGPEVFAASELAPRLVALGLGMSRLDAAATTALFGSGRFANLTRLVLGANRPGHPIVLALVASSLPRLARLSLRTMDLTTGSAEALAAWPGAATLRHLDLAYNIEIRIEGLRALVNSPHLAGLESLRVSVPTASVAEARQLLVERFGVLDNPLDLHALTGVRRRR